ncbi:MAG: hypothetical protein Ct9H300mP23_03250 [Nitrospinota bacterium]|nr:MAG: hypothetical protein Ct9H300mP23_03250 [Nitrospinota bacterium]
MKHSKKNWSPIQKRAIEEQGLKAVDGIKIAFDEVTKVFKVGVDNGSNEEVTAEGKWWGIRLKMIKEFWGGAQSAGWNRCRVRRRHQGREII